MNKLLYAVPALAILGLIPAADADTVQERIEKLQERIAGLQERIEFFEAKIDRNPDSEKVAKWEARIDRLHDRMTELEDRLQKRMAELEPVQTTQTIKEPTAPQEPTSARAESDMTPPTVRSATLEGTTLTIVFSETIDFDKISLGKMYFDFTSLSGATIINPSTDSDTLSLTLPETLSDAIREASNPAIDFIANAVADVSGDLLAGTSVSVVIADSTPADTDPPQVLSATHAGDTLTVVFDEEVTVVHGHVLSIDSGTVIRSSVSVDSDTLTATLSNFVLDRINTYCADQFQILPGAIRDGSGNFVTGTFDFARETCDPPEPRRSTEPWTVPDGVDVPMIATVTLEDGRWENSPGTVELAKSDLMVFSVDFVNNDDRTHTVYVDLISYDFWHSGLDMSINPGGTLNTTPLGIYGHMQPGDIAHLVYGVADDPNTPEHEPDTIRGDQVVKIRITEPAGETETPDMETPDMETPDMETPDMETPDMETPDMETPDTTAPDLLSAELDTGTGILTATFSEAVDVSTVRVSGFELYTGKASIVLSEAELETAADSDTLTLRLSEAELDRFNMADKTAPTLIVDANCVADTDGNFNDTEEATLTTV